MKTKQSQSQTRDEIFRQRAQTYVVCNSVECPLREHCLHAILSHYAPENELVRVSINLNNPEMQREDCPMYRVDEPCRMPVGFTKLYYDMPGRLERAIRDQLYSAISHRMYYEYRNGTRPIPPEFEQIIRDTLLKNGWKEEPCFDGYTEEYIW